MSLRATGEGHISSIVFRSGVLDSDNRVLFDPTSDYVETPDIHFDPVYDRHLFDLKLLEMEASVRSPPIFLASYRKISPIMN